MPDPAPRPADAAVAGEPPTPRSTAHTLAAEIAVEQAHVDRVYARVDELTTATELLVAEGHGRAQLGHEGGVRDDDLAGLYERDVLVHHAARRRATLEAEREGLVFGRLDLVRGAPRYVGRIGVRDTHHDPLVVDWRAPAAEPFYQATAARPDGIVRRRVLTCKGEQVVGLEDELLDPANAPAGMPVLGEGALMAALDAARGHHMRDIVATIQREQDQIIRAPVRGATLISGGPGTGKTVVALHRAAFLLYADRRRVESGGVLVVGPSSAFTTYIERVLPSLGEEAATLRSVGELFPGVRATRHDPADVALLKGSAAMHAVLARAVRAVPAGVPSSLQVFAAGRRLRLAAADLARVRRQVLRGRARHNRARRDAERALAAALAAQAEPPGTPDHAALAAALTGRDELAEFVRRWWAPLAPGQVLATLADADRLRAAAGRDLSAGDVERLAPTLRGEPTVEDVPLLDELRMLLGPPPVAAAAGGDAADEEADALGLDLRGIGAEGERAEPEPAPAWADSYDGYAHVLVDEAQDLSPMQWRVLGRLGRRASWTIVGDPAQSSWPDTGAATAAMHEALGWRDRHRFRLSTNYRNPAEIFDLATRVIRTVSADADLPVAVRSTGHEPVRITVAAAELPGAVRSAVQELLAGVEGTVAAVGPEGGESELARWLAAELAAAGDRLEVTSARGTKGLEYDAVLVVRPSVIGAEPLGVRLLYVALTRATQRLTLVDTRPWPA